MTKATFLQERDHKLIDFLHRFKVAGVEDIREMIFNGISINHVYKRLKWLMEMGIIKKIPYHKETGRAVCIYSLTGKAFKRYVLGDDDQSLHKQFQSDNPDHDLAILAIYKRLLKSPRKVDFIPENHLFPGSAVVKSLGLEDWTRNHPDGLMVDELKDGTYYLPLECELAVKTTFRYESKFYNYYRCNRIPAIIYICKNTKIRDILRKTEVKYCNLYTPKYSMA